MCAHQVRSYGPFVTSDHRSTEPSSGAPAADHTATVQYELRVKGHLGDRWAAWFDGLSLTNSEDGSTVIRGPVIDQAALHGVLQKLRDIGIPLISLVQLRPEAPSAPPAPRTRTPEGN